MRKILLAIHYCDRAKRLARGPRKVEYCRAIACLKAAKAGFGENAEREHYLAAARQHLRNAQVA